MRNIAEVTTAVARGDLSRKITVDVKGEILELKNTINTMVDQLNAFAAEVTRVAREVGTDGKLGGQAQVPGVAGTWKDLTDNVNVMAANLTEQVRGIVKVVTAVANGELTQKLTVNAKGEVAALAETINNMTDTLATFADQVTTVAREVGVEGRLGGQANVPGAAGTWKDLTGNVNLLADNLTNQVRAIAEVATAVTKGDLTRSIQVEARGEVAELKDNINTMIDNLRLTTDRNTEQDWLKTNLARFTGMLQGPARSGHRRPHAALGAGAAGQRAAGRDLPDGDGRIRRHGAALGVCRRRRRTAIRSACKSAKGLVGQCAAEKRRMLITDLPANTVPIRSGLFEAVPRNVIVLPVLFEDRVKAVIELASLSTFTASHLAFLEQLTASIGIVLNTIEATMQTEGLLKQSQQLATELQTQQKELQQTNEQLAQKAQQLAEQNVEVERKNQEIEQARRALEEKAKELALTSKYKSEFLANMSHELRTPLNSILVLGQQLSDNPDGNLTPKQVEFARTIHGAGTDLLNLISDILDLSKIESGTVSVEAEEVFFASLLEMVARPFRHEAENRRLTFEVHTDPHLTRSLVTDSKRLQQVLKNLLSNAFKFTEQGGVRLSVSLRRSGWSEDHPILERRGLGDRVRGYRYRHRHPAREAAHHLRGLPAGRRRHQPQVRRHRSGPGHQPRTGQPARRRNSAAQRARQGQHVHALSAADLCRSIARQSRRGREAHRPQLAAAAVAAAALPNAQSSRFADDRDNLQPDDAVLLIVEDDPHYARVLCDLSRDKGFKVLVAMRGAEALALAREFHPTAVSLDVFLPDMLGWTVLNHLKQDPATRHIPVQMLTLDEDRQHGLARGAFSFVTKPTTTEGLEAALDRIKEYAAPRRKRLLVVEDNPAEQLSIRELLGHDDIDVSVVATGAEALEAMSSEQRSIAWCSTCACPTCPASKCWSSLRDTPALERLAGGRLHRQGTVAGGRCPPAHAGAQRRGQGRRIAGAAAGRDGAVPASRGRRSARRKNRRCSTGCTVPTRRWSARKCWSSTTTCATSSPEQRSGTPRHDRADRRHRPRSDRHARIHSRPGHRPDGHHDAGNGRLRNDAGDPAESVVPPPADHRADRQSHEGRSREVPGSGRVGISGQAGEHRATALGVAHVAASVALTSWSAIDRTHAETERRR